MCTHDVGGNRSQAADLALCVVAPVSSSPDAGAIAGATAAGLAVGGAVGAGAAAYSTPFASPKKGGDEVEPPVTPAPTEVSACISSALPHRLGSDQPRRVACEKSAANKILLKAACRGLEAANVKGFVNGLRFS